MEREDHIVKSGSSEGQRIDNENLHPTDTTHSDQPHSTDSASNLSANPQRFQDPAVFVDDKDGNGDSVQESAPVEEESAPLEEESAPLEEESAPLEEESAPLEEESAPLEEESAPLEEESAPLEEEAAQAPVVAEAAQAPVVAEAAQAEQELALVQAIEMEINREMCNDCCNCEVILAGVNIIAWFSTCGWFSSGTHTSEGLAAVVGGLIAFTVGSFVWCVRRRPVEEPTQVAQPIQIEMAQLPCESSSSAGEYSGASSETASIAASSSSQVIEMQEFPLGEQRITLSPSDVEESSWGEPDPPSPSDRCSSADPQPQQRRRCSIM